MSIRCLIASLTAAALLLSPSAIYAADLNVTPIAQETPEWCWAASSSMVLDYLGVPNLNPGRDYQCGVVGARGGVCQFNCLACQGAGGTTFNIAAVIKNYLFIAHGALGFDDSNIRINTKGILSMSDIVSQIDDSKPVIAGISPMGLGFPAGLGISDHAVVIEGYDGDADDDDFSLIVNDPYPPTRSIWLLRGASEIIPGQYRIKYFDFINLMKYRNSITFN